MLHSGSQVSLGGGDPLQLRDLAGEVDRGQFRQRAHRYNERELHRAWADTCFATRNFLMDNYIRFSRISSAHRIGGITPAMKLKMAA